MEREIRMIDIVDPENRVEVSVDVTAGNPETVTLWINVDGICRLRVSQINPHLFEMNWSPKTVTETTHRWDAKIKEMIDAQKL